MVNETARAYAEAARGILDDVRFHKRAQHQHKQKTRELMHRLAGLRRECERLGISLVEIEATSPEGGRGARTNNDALDVGERGASDDQSQTA